MKKFLAIAVAFAVASSAGANTSVKLGYSSFPIKMMFAETNVNTNVVTNGSEALSAGVLAISAESMTKVNDMLSIGMEVVAGAPMGEAEQDLTKQYTDLEAAGITWDPLDGDSKTFKVATLGVLAKAKMGMKIDAGTIGLGIGAGSVVASIMETEVDTDWDITFPGSTLKGAAAAVKTSKTTTYSTTVVPLFAVVIAPSFDMPLSETDSVGVEIPLALLSTTRLGTDTDLVTPAVGDDNPAKDGAEIGGFSWGVNVAYTKKF
jgi:hypothetical protein